jgi:hypothetical protein
MIPAPDFVFASTSKSGVPSDFINLKASNGRVILTSEPYQKERGAQKGISSVQKNAGTDTRYETRATKDGKPYFILKASNGEVIGQSEVYSSASAARKGITSVKKHGAGGQG